MVKTKQQLQEMFRLSRERKAKERLLERQELEQQKKKALEEHLKAQEREKMIGLEKAMAIAKRIAQIKRIKQLKQEKQQRTPIKEKPQSLQQLWSQREITHGFDEHDLYLTREELMQAEERGEGKINWKVWDELLELNRKTINILKK